MEVICDLCNKQWTNKDKEQGGFITHSWGICPDCAPGMLKTMENTSELDQIHSKQKPNTTFYEFIEDYRFQQTILSLLH